MKLQRWCLSSQKLFLLFVLLQWFWLGDVHADLDDEEDDDDDDETGTGSKRNNIPSDILLAHVYVDSKYPDKSRKSAGLPQTISHKKAMRLLEKTPIRYYAGTTSRQHLHICQTDPNSDEFYVWYAWRGPDLKRDGSMVQVFQVKTGAPMEHVANVLKQFGELDEQNPFVTFDNVQILTFLYAMARQREARSPEGGLVGAHVYLQPWKRLYSDGMTEQEITQAQKNTETLVEETTTSILKAPARIRATQHAKLDDSSVQYNYVVIEEDSDFGSLYDQVWSLVKYVIGYDPGTRYAQEWGKRAVYKFLANATASNIKKGIRVFHSGKITGKRLEALLEKAWPKELTSQTENDSTSVDTAESSTSETSTTADESDFKDASTDPSGINAEL
mmetsp:Transcript_4209/g.8526  ORF Transcript_4209/g.8526 Transcript_4209/m.8526 type:complete len:388 (+) Transcript_4209:163-1326(+)|eukprot:scaffold278_cov195-Amphora_coffeaeformis.AAC.9